MHILTRPMRLAVPMLLALAVSAAAQIDPAPATAPATTPASQPATIPTAPPTRPFSTTRPATALSNHVKFDFSNAPIDSITDYLATSFGLSIIKDHGVNITGRITVKAPGEVGVDEAINQLDIVLKEISPGYTAILTGKVLRIALRSDAQAIAKVYVGNKADDIPETEVIRTQVIPLLNVDAVRLKQDLAGLFSADANVVANAASNTLIITDSCVRIHHIVEIVAAMDNQPTTTSDLQVFKLKYANAAAAAKLITDIFSPSTSSSNNQNGRGQNTFQFGGGGFGGFGGFGGRGGGGAPGGGGAATPDTSGTTARTGKVTASSDDRTNTVVVTAPKDTLKAIAGIIKEIDSDPALETSFFVYPLKNANAVNLQSVLNGLFGGSSSGGSTNNSRSSNGFTALGQSTSSGLGGSSGGRGSSSSSGFGSTSSSSSRTGSTSSTGSSSGRPGTSTGTGSGTTASGDLTGLAFVVADPDTNSLLVTVKTQYKEKVTEIIAQLDRDIAQVLIKVLVCEVTHTNSSDIGVEYSVLNQRSIPTVTSAGVAGTTLGGNTEGTAFGIENAITNAALSGSPGGLVASVVEQNLSAAIRLLASTGKLDVLSRPSILASDNQLASIMVGQLIPIITASNITTEGTIVNSVSYQQVGIILNVTPHINPDGLVILDVAPTISQLSATTVTIQAGVNVPVIDQRQAQSRVSIQSGQTIIIGGLMQDQKTETTDKIPLLGDIPWLGQLFSHTTKSKTKTELLIFLTPQVAQSPSFLPAMSADERQGTQLVPNAVDPGVFDEHMQGMSRGAAKTRDPNGPFNVIPTHPAPIPNSTPPGTTRPPTEDPPIYHIPNGPAGDTGGGGSE